MGENGGQINDDVFVQKFLQLYPRLPILWSQPICQQIEISLNYVKTFQILRDFYPDYR